MAAEQPAAVSTLLGLVDAHAGAGTICLVGIDGHSGAGKTWLAETVQHCRPDTQIVTTDEFGHHGGVATEWRRLLSEVLLPLREGTRAAYRPWDWTEDRPAAERVIIPGGLVLVEGVGALRREVAACYTLRVWMETPRAVCLERVFTRVALSATSPELVDARRRWEQWYDRVAAYVAEHQPRLTADLVLGDEPAKYRATR